MEPSHLLSDQILQYEASSSSKIKDLVWENILQDEQIRRPLVDFIKCSSILKTFEDFFQLWNAVKKMDPYQQYMNLACHLLRYLRLSSKGEAAFSKIANLDQNPALQILLDYLALKPTDSSFTCQKLVYDYEDKLLPAYFASGQAQISKTSLEEKAMEDLAKALVQLFSNLGVKSAYEGEIDLSSEEKIGMNVDLFQMFLQKNDGDVEKLTEIISNPLFRPEQNFQRQAPGLFSSPIVDFASKKRRVITCVEAFITMAASKENFPDVKVYPTTYISPEAILIPADTEMIYFTFPAEEEQTLCFSPVFRLRNQVPVKVFAQILNKFFSHEGEFIPRCSLNTAELMPKHSVKVKLRVHSFEGFPDLNVLYLIACYLDCLIKK